MSKDTISERVALLDFYSNKAMAHASYSVAFIISLFTVLGIANGNDNLQEWLRLAVSWLVWFCGLYCLINFRFFSELAEKAKHAIATRTLTDFHIKDFVGKKWEDDNVKVAEIEEGLLRSLIMEWKLSLLRRLFTRLKMATIYKSIKEDEEWNKCKKVYATRLLFIDFIYVPYLVIFLLASIAVFGFPLGSELTCEFFNLLLAVIMGVLVLLDSSWLRSRLRSFFVWIN